MPGGACGLSAAVCMSSFLSIGQPLPIRPPPRLSGVRARQRRPEAGDARPLGCAPTASRCAPSSSPAGCTAANRARRDASEVLTDVLLSEPAHRDLPPGADRDRRAEDLLGQEDALGVVTQGAVAYVGGDRLCRVEPVVDRLVVLRFAAPLLGGADGMVVWVGHQLHPLGGCCWSHARDQQQALTGVIDAEQVEQRLLRSVAGEVFDPVRGRVYAARSSICSIAAGPAGTPPSLAIWLL